MKQRQARIAIGLVLASGSLLGLVACSDDDRGGLLPDGGAFRPADGGPSGEAGVGSDGGAYAALDGGPAPRDAGVGLQPIAIDQCGADNPAGLSSADTSKLMAGAGAGPRILHPYDGTVYPRGLTAPSVMWEDDSASAAYVHIHGSLVDYRGCLPVTGGAVQIPQDVWVQLGNQTGGAAEPLTLEVSSLAGGTVRGPAAVQIVVAPATLKGSIYYNSYSSLVAVASGSAQGAVLRIKPGRPVEAFARFGTCAGCHSVSANGTRLVANDFFGLSAGGPGAGLVYAIAPETPANPAPLRSGGNNSFAGLTPDGSLYVTCATATGLGPLLNGGALPVIVPSSSQLIETDTGNVVPSAIPTGAMMPSFSPDGRLLTFVDLSQNGGRNVSVMDFDPATRVASNLRLIYAPPSGNVGWPFILPDNRAVVFTLTDSGQFSGEGAGITPGRTGPRSDLMIVEVAGGNARMLANAMGYRTPADAQSETTYLPFGAEELHRAYYPTVSPIAAGGYFWLLFDSVRHYGNKGNARQLWGTALRIPPTGEFTAYEDDPSSPPFYLEGQEFGTANHRGFTALDPCRADGSSCESGVDCCTGFCTDGSCGVQQPRCSRDGEACKAASDCCDTSQDCIGGYCTTLLR